MHIMEVGDIPQKSTKATVEGEESPWSFERSWKHRAALPRWRPNGFSLNSPSYLRAEKTLLSRF